MEQNPNLLDWSLILCFVEIRVYRGWFLLCAFGVLVEMQPPQQHSRINIAELKAQIEKKLGPDRSKQYFHFLDKFLSFKINKVEFNKLCHKILGRENIPLHNHFIRSILKNACTAKHPPPSNIHAGIKSNNAARSKETPTDGFLQNGSHSAAAQASNPQGLSNGDILPLSPRKARTMYRDRRSGDRRSALGANGKTNFASEHLPGKELNFVLENGISVPLDAQGSTQQHQGIILHGENEREASAKTPSKLPVTKGSPDGPVSVHSKDYNEVSVGREGKDMHARSQLKAPLGVPLYPASIGGARRGMAMASTSKCVSTSNCGLLLDSETLKGRMEQIAASQGLEGVSVDCANLLNNGLDAYLKGLISSCTGLVASRSGYEPVKNKKQQLFSKTVNGVRPGHLYQIQSGGKPLEVMPEPRSHSSFSLHDFRVAMELNPQQLGEDWPLLLEKLCTRAYEE